MGKVKYRDHARLCEDNQPLRIVMPNEDLKLTFNNWEKTQKLPFVVYADLEELNVPADTKMEKKAINIEKQYHASYGAFLVDCRTNSMVAEPIYCGKDCISKLMNRLRRWLAWCNSETQKYRYLNHVISSQQQKRMTGAKTGATCFVCREVVQICPVAHLCHSSGKIIGLA